MPADLAVIGLGPFGLPLAQAAVAAGIPTIGYRTGPEAGSLNPAELRRMLSGASGPPPTPPSWAGYARPSSAPPPRATRTADSTSASWRRPPAPSPDTCAPTPP